MTKAQYAVMGNPIGHSRSPMIHQRFAEQTGEPVEYRAERVPLDGFADAVERFFDQGEGLNITVPFKQEAWNLAGMLTERARRAEAVNTLWQEQGVIWGDTTDGVGLVRDLRDNQQVRLSGARILVLGAGGAVRGVLEPLLAEQPGELWLANRTLSKAQQLADIFSQQGTIKPCGFPDPRGAFDLIINGTSASLSGDLPPLDDSVVGPATVAYDMMYGRDETVFNRWARELGAARCIDGLGMLVEQAAESFAIWRRVRPETAPVIAQLRAELCGS